ncbi:FecR family protein [Massilia agilis]|uniref:FecR family protein n=1 Tax=Massilia agilis TaxID=1811226 RepID=A0ABT2DF43_9BURK|nr:FecR family protein [Massilia agilis]MCS0809945.1 FecR family protein [Massilia agilis]
MLRRSILVCSVALAAQAHAAEAGKVIFAAGATTIAERAAAEGAPVQEGDLLATGADGYLYVKTADNGLFILRPNTRARIVTYHIDTKDPANTRVKLELINGVARSKSGDAVKLARQNFRFNTPVAAIGVRGTDFTVYTDPETSRVAVLTGRVIVSGFGGACSPDGAGPCEGAASRELSAAQRGQLLQVKRGQLAPQLLAGSAGAPDQLAPPRTDEPLAKAGAPGDTAIDVRKADSIDKMVAQQPSTPVVTPPPVVDSGPPAGPQREIQWGRWSTVAGVAPTAPFTGPEGAERLVNSNFVIFRTAGPEYVLPERGSVAFNLKGSEAYIFNSNPAVAALPAQVQNGLFSVDFGKAAFTTSFDLVAGSETFKMIAEGAVSSAGRFANNQYLQYQNNNMQVDGVLSNANGGSAAYLFERRLDDTRKASGVTYWAH